MPNTLPFIKSIELPTQVVVGPVIGSAVTKVSTLTAWVTLALHSPVVVVYTTVSKPCARPPTTPPALLTESIAGCRTVHTPPETVSANAIVAPLHTIEAPVITPVAGNGLMIV